MEYIAHKNQELGKADCVRCRKNLLHLGNYKTSQSKNRMVFRFFNEERNLLVNSQICFSNYYLSPKR